MNISALEQSVRQILLHRSCSISEYELIKEVGALGLLDNCSVQSAAVALFQKHFLIMHVLYRLQDEFAQLGQYLRIDPLSIELRRLTQEPAGGDVDPCPLAPLRHYYLDMDNFHEAEEDDILALLSGFWQRYQAWENADDAFTELGLDANSSWPEIQLAYRRLIRDAHPDRGGDATRFRKIFEAYQSLKLRVKPE